MKILPLATMLLVAVALVAAACSGSDDSAEPTTTSETGSSASAEGSNDTLKAPDEVVDRTADVLGVSKGSVELNDPYRLGGSNCFLQTAYSTESTAYGARYAVLESGDVLAQGETDAVAQILDACGSDISADDWAEIIVRIDATPSPIRVLAPLLSRRVEELDITYTEPAVTANGGDRTLKFFATGIEFADVFDVTATHSADGSLTVTYDQLASG